MSSSGAGVVADPAGIDEDCSVLQADTSSRGNESMKCFSILIKQFIDFTDRGLEGKSVTQVTAERLGIGQSGLPGR